MNLIKANLLITMMLSIIQINAQDNIVSYEAKKGQVFDIILLNTKPDTDSLVKDYFSTAYPIAQEMSYKPLPGFNSTQNPLEGNYHPSYIVFGTWESMEHRTGFSNRIMKDLPTFHDKRKAIWSTFNLTYYLLEEDLSYEINKDKFNVLTAIWSKDNDDFQNYRNQIIKKTKKNNGKIKLHLTNGESPFGYYYNPELMMITEWNSQKDYENFKNSLENKESLKLINEFILD